MLPSVKNTHSNSPTPIDIEPGQRGNDKSLTPETLLKSRTDFKTPFDFHLPGESNNSIDFIVPPRIDSGKITDQQILNALALLNPAKYSMDELPEDDGSTIICTLKQAHAASAEGVANVPKVTLRIDKNKWLKSCQVDTNTKNSSWSFCAYFEEKLPSALSLQTKRPHWTESATSNQQPATGEEA